MTVLGRLVLGRYTGLLVALVAVGVYLTLTEDVFLTWDNLMNIGKSNSVVFVLAIGATFVVISGGIDLSIASAATAAGMILGLTMDAGWSIVAVLAVTLLFATLSRRSQRSPDHEAEDLVPGRHAGDALDLSELRAGRERRPDDLCVRQAGLLGPQRLRQRRDRAVSRSCSFSIWHCCSSPVASCATAASAARSSPLARIQRPHGSTESTSGASFSSRTPSRGLRPGWRRWSRSAASPAPPRRPTRRCC